MDGRIESDVVRDTPPPFLGGGQLKTHRKAEKHRRTGSFPLKKTRNRSAMEKKTATTRKTKKRYRKSIAVNVGTSSPAGQTEREREKEKSRNANWDAIKEAVRRSNVLDATPVEEPVVFRSSRSTSLVAIAHEMALQPTPLEAPPRRPGRRMQLP